MIELRLSVDTKVYEALERLRVDTRAKDLVEVFRNALKTYEWVVHQLNSGMEISVSQSVGRSATERARLVESEAQLLRDSSIGT